MSSFNAWVNIPLTHATKGPVYRLWKAVHDLLSGGMVGLLTIVDCSAGSAPDWNTGWTSDTSLADGDWIVVQWANGWADGTKQQVFLGVRTTTGNLAGFGSKNAGLYVAMSTIGGWNAVGKYFGASLADWRNGLFNCEGHASGTTMAMALTSGIANQRPGAFAFASRTGSGSHKNGCYAGALVAPGGNSDQKYRSQLAFGDFAPIYIEGYSMFRIAGDYGRCPVTTLDAVHSSHMVHIIDSSAGVSSGDYGGGVDVDGGYLRWPINVRDCTTTRKLGALDCLENTSAPDGTVLTDGSRWVWNGIAWPRESARDGNWV